VLREEGNAGLKGRATEGINIVSEKLVGSSALLASNSIPLLHNPHLGKGGKSTFSSEGA
jgi:hypothetical protein